MSDHSSQGVNELSIAELILNAKAESEKQLKVKEKAEDDHYMSLRKNVRLKLRGLYFILKPTEYFIAELICDQTVDWKHQYEDIDLTKLAMEARIRMDVLRAALKSLDKRGVIKRIPHPRLKFTETMCLNPEYFGQILIDRQTKNDKSHLKPHVRAVDNSKEGTTNHGSRNQDLCHGKPRIVVPETKNRGNSEKNHQSNQQGMAPLHPLPISNSYIPFLDPENQGAETGKSFTQLGVGTGTQKPKRTQEEHERMVKEQLAQLKEGKVLGA